MQDNFMFRRVKCFREIKIYADIITAVVTTFDSDTVINESQFSLRMPNWDLNIENKSNTRDLACPSFFK